MENEEFIDDIQKKINRSYIMQSMKNSIEKNKKKIKSYMEIERQIFDFMYSKLNKVDKEHVQKLLREKEIVISGN